MGVVGVTSVLQPLVLGNSCVFNLSLVLLLKNFFGPAVCGILVPWPAIEPMSSALAAQSLNHWTAKEVHSLAFCNESFNEAILES